jgi:hypothetical protein
MHGVVTFGLNFCRLESQSFVDNSERGSDVSRMCREFKRGACMHGGIIVEEFEGGKQGRARQSGVDHDDVAVVDQNWASESECSNINESLFIIRDRQPSKIRPD